MGFIEIREGSDRISQRQRWGHYFVLIFGVVGFIIGLNLRDGALFATTQYADTRAGIRAFYPQNWLLDTGGDDYIFRVRDMAQSGFKTTIQVAVEPIGFVTSTRNVLEALSLERSQTFASYSVLAVEPFLLRGEIEATTMAYAFASTNDDPFLESVPDVVRGYDVLLSSGGQVVIVSFRSDADTFDANFPVFEQFLDDLEF